MKRSFLFLGLLSSCLIFLSCQKRKISSSSATVPEISSWTFVDVNGANGLNKDSTKDAIQIRAVEFNSKIYAAWYETNGTAFQVRVAVYNGTDSSPAWTFVDGNGTNGINYNTSKATGNPQLNSFNSKLYATWVEFGATSNQVRVAVYNGNDSSPSWAFVDGNGASGLNKDTTRDAFVPFLHTFNSKQYLMWPENNGGSIQIRAAVYNGNDGAPAWTFVDGNGSSGLNKDTNYSATFVKPITFNNELYAVWAEGNAGGITQIRVALYNGNDGAPVWSFVDGNGANGLNKNTAQNATHPRAAVVNSKLYVVWYEDAGGSVNQIRAAVFNGNTASPDWTMVDGDGSTGLNYDTTKSAINPQVTESNSKLYAIWSETDGSKNQARVKVYGGDDASPSWTFVDGNLATGLNKDSTKSAHFPFILPFSTRLYAFWYEPTASANNVRAKVGQ